MTETTTYKRGCLAAAFLTGACFFVLCAVLGVTPFGDNTFLYYDMKREYVDYYAFYRSMFAGENDIFYSLSKGLGGEIPGVFAYYLTSPLLLFFAFIERHQLPLAITCLLALKLSLCALTTEYYLLKRVSQRADVTVPFAMSFAFSAWMFANITNTMWLDAVIVMPLVFLCMMRLTEDSSRRAFLLQALTVFFMIWLNYYIAYMILLFTVVWAFVRVFVTKRGEHAVRRFAFFCLSLGTGAGLTGVLMLPTVAALSESAKSGGFFAALSSRPLWGSPLSLLKRLLPFTFDTIQIFEGDPQIYCGVLITMMCAGFFLHPGKRGTKIEGGILLAFLLSAFLFTPLDLVMHGFAAPEGYRFRYAFLFAFGMCVMASRFAASLLGKRRLTFSVLFLVLIQAADVAANDFLIYRMMSQQQITASEFKEAVDTGMRQYADALLQESEAVAKGEAGSGSVFRTERTKPREQNDAMMFGYHGVTVYDSEDALELRLFLRRLGLNYNGLYASYEADMPKTLTALLGVRYLLDREGAVRTDALPFAAATSTAAREQTMTLREETSAAADPFSLMTAMLKEALSAAGAKDLAAADDVFEEAQITNEPTITRTDEAAVLRASFTTGRAGDLFFYMPGITDTAQNTEVLINDVSFGGFADLSSMKIIPLGYHDRGATVRVELRSYDAPEKTDFGQGTPLLMTENEDALHGICETLLTRAVTVTEHASSRFSFTLPADADGALLLIPFHSGLSARVTSGNGKDLQATLSPALDSFTALRLSGPDGTYDSSGTGSETGIELTFTPAGLLPGCALSLLSLVLLIAVCQREPSLLTQRKK